MHDYILNCNLSKLIGPLSFISYFKANFSTYRNDQRPKFNFKSSSLLYRNESVRKSIGVNLLYVNWIIVHLCYNEKDQRNLISAFFVQI